MSTFKVTIDSLKVAITEVTDKAGNLAQEHSINDSIPNICVCATILLIVAVICLTYYLIRNMEHKKTVKRLVNDYLKDHVRVHEELNNYQKNHDRALKDLNKRIEEILQVINEQI